MANLQIRLTDELKAQADELEVKHNTSSREMRQALYESRNRVNLNGPYDTAEEAVKAMLDD